MNPKQIHSLLSIGLEPETPAVTDRGLFCLALSAGESGIGHAIEQLNNIFLRAGEKYEMNTLSHIAKTEPNPVSMSPAVAKQEEAAEGPATDGNKPLMRNRTGHQMPSATGTTAGDTLSTHPDFPFFVVRSLQGGRQEVELAIQVRHYEAPSIDSLDHRDPAHNSGVVEFGDAVQVDTGTTMELSEMEWERAHEQFFNQ